MQATGTSQRRQVRRIGRADDWLNIRLDSELRKQLSTLAERQGFNTVSGFVRAVLIGIAQHQA